MEEKKKEEITEEELSWKDRHDVIKTIKVSDKSFGWMHLILAKRKDDGELVIRLKKYRNWFAISSQKQLVIIKRMLDKGAEELGWTVDVSDKDLEKMINKNKELGDIKVKTKKQITHQKETIDRLLEQVSTLREEKFSINLEEFKKDIKELKKLLNDNSKEKEIQSWLYEHPWMFGPNYVEGTKEEINRKGDRIDFLLQRYDTFYDVIELKLPTCKIFIGEEKGNPQEDISRKYTMSAEVKDAISQVIGYLETYEIDKTNILWEKNIAIHKPKGIIVIGRSEEKNKRALKSLNSYLHGIQLVTYDEMVEIGTNFVRLIENRKKSKRGKK